MKLYPISGNEDLKFLFRNSLFAQEDYIDST